MKKYGFVFAVTALMLTISACFSPWAGDKGYVAIGTNAGPAGTMLPTTSELAVMTYKVTLSGPGGTIHKTFGAGGGTVELVPGRWHIAVTAYNSDPRIRGIAEQDITVSGGKTETVVLTSAVGIKTEADLTAMFTDTSPYTGTSEDHHLLVLENDILLTGAISFIAAGTTIIAEPGTTRRIIRQAANGQIAVSGLLTLGRPGENGKLVIDGNNVSAAVPFFDVATSSDVLTVDGNTEITRCINDSTTEGGAIRLTGGILNIKSGKITGNKHQPTSSPARGGAVYANSAVVNIGPGPVEISGNWAETSSAFADGGALHITGSGSSLTLGGNVLISGNHAEGSVGNGGGIAINESTPITIHMNGGRITGNYAAGDGGQGGGVYINGPGPFEMYGGSIDGNFAEGGISQAQGGGVHVSGLGAFNLYDGASINGNTARLSLVSNDGGGVYVGGAFTMNGGTVNYNRAEGVAQAQGGGICNTGTSLTLNRGSVSYNKAVSDGSQPANGGGINTTAIGGSGGPVIVTGNYSYSDDMTNGTKGWGIKGMSSAPSHVSVYGNQRGGSGPAGSEVEL